jgi:hypothetical protein
MRSAGHNHQSAPCANPPPQGGESSHFRAVLLIGRAQQLAVYRAASRRPVMGPSSLRALNIETHTCKCKVEQSLLRGRLAVLGGPSQIDSDGMVLTDILSAMRPADAGEAARPSAAAASGRAAGNRGRRSVHCWKRLRQRHLHRCRWCLPPIGPCSIGETPYTGSCFSYPSAPVSLQDTSTRSLRVAE